MKIEFIPNVLEYAAFQDEDDGSYEMARILRRVADQIKGGYRRNTMHDINGNKVGTWSMGD